MDVLNRIANTNPKTFDKMNLNYKINHIGFGDNTDKIADVSK